MIRKRREGWDGMRKDILYARVEKILLLIVE
jgi:hypothetical protein